MAKMEIPATLPPGVFHFSGWLSLDRQIDLVQRCRAIGAAEAGFYRPTVRGGARMRISMVCLGRHWNPLTYRYEPVRSDYDERPVQPIPPDFTDLGRAAAAAAGYEIHPDICILNLYNEDGRLGLHQDKDERPETLAAGIPIVSISLGQTARFLLGGTRRRDPIRTLLLRSGDALVMGGPARLRYHGVTGLIRGSGPLELELDGRFNLTFRQY